MNVTAIVLTLLGAPTFITGAVLIGGGTQAIMLGGLAMLVGACAISIGLAYLD